MLIINKNLYKAVYYFEDLGPNYPWHKIPVHILHITERDYFTKYETDYSSVVYKVHINNLDRIKFISAEDFDFVKNRGVIFLNKNDANVLPDTELTKILYF